MANSDEYLKFCEDWLGNFHEGCQVIDFNWRYIYLNRTAIRHSRRRKKDLLGRTMMEVYPGIENTEVFKSLRLCMKERTAGRMVYKFVFPDGIERWFDIIIEPVPVGIMVLSIDVTDRIKRQEKISHLYSLQNVIRKINQEIVRTKDEICLFQRICAYLTEVDYIRFAWIGLINKNSYEISPVAYAGWENGYLSSIKIRWDDSQYGQGPAGTALKTLKTSIIPEISTDSRFGPWKEEALKRGYASVIAVPIKSEGLPIGVLVIYSGEKNAFGEEEVGFLEKVAMDIGIGVKSIRMSRQLEKNLEVIQQTIENAIKSIARICEQRDPYTAGHQERVAELCCGISKKLNIGEEQIKGLKLAALIHDIGKVCIPFEVLNKPGKLTPVEFELIKTHPIIAYDVLKNINFPWPIVKTIYQHHERLDGSGYPLGVSGTEIILEARILAVADVVEAMCSHRPYRPALGVDVALQEISKKKSVLYDADVVDACLFLFEKEGFQFKHPFGS